jgi:hypothetical protein
MDHILLVKHEGKRWLGNVILKWISKKYSMDLICIAHDGLQQQAPVVMLCSQKAQHFRGLFT